MKKLAVLTLLITLFAAYPFSSALAQDYSFQVTNMDVHAFWNEDGTLSLDYVITFQNDPQGHPIEFVDLGLPNNNFDVSSISADANGQPLGINASDYQGQGSGVAIEMGRQTIPPGQSGSVHVFIGRIEGVVYEDELEDEYASVVLAPARFLSSTAHGNTNMTVTFHLPPGVEPDQPRWHESPPGWSEEPETGFDEQGRIIYIWRNPNAEVWDRHELGASFPLTFVPESAIVTSSPFAWLGNTNLVDCCLPLLCFGFIGGTLLVGIISGQRRKMQYLPPKISVEGHGIKRGLTAVEAAVLMEQPMDKILTMILFGLIKKNAAEVVSRDPLVIKPAAEQPVNLWEYEKDFLNAFQEPSKAARERDLQKAMVALIKSLSNKMKGFSRKETIAYYKDIMDRAWAQVEAADTPEVKSQKYDENMEWTMLDRNWNDRTRDVFRSGPVFVPIWYPRYDPTFGRGSASVPSGRPTVTGGGKGGGPSLPVLPGADFAASVVGGAQNFASNVVGNLTNFTSKVTNVTNPVPKSSGGSYRGGGGGGGCACACACAGCACACAGGGR